MIPIIKVTDRCNLRCQYCHAKRGIRNMSLNVYQATLSWCLKHRSCKTQPISLIHHGGEPLLLGKKRFQEFLRIQDKLGAENFVNVVQTNATLIDLNWATFFKINSFQVGTSLDGLVEHNSLRVDKQGRNSFSQSLRGLRLLRDHSLEPHVNIVVHEKNVEESIRIIDFLRKESIRSASFSPKICYSNGNIDPFNSLSPQAYFTFMRSAFDYWFSNNYSDLRLSEFFEMIALLLGKKSSLCLFKRSCKNYITVFPDGTVGPCDRFSSYCNDRYGDFCGPAKSKIYQRRARLWDKIETQPACESCEFKNICNGGCPAQRLNSGKGNFYYCQYYKAILSHMRSYLKPHEESCFTCSA